MTGVVQTTLKCCFVVPHYCHESLLPALMHAIEPLGIPAIIVDDGSPAASRVALKTLVEPLPNVQLVLRDTNGGKGAAVKDGLREAYRLGYSHAIQIDADGQHDLGDLPTFLRVAEQYPDVLVSGQPIFGDDVPPSRLHGRKLTNFWIHIETLSHHIPDAMCGYRVYPLASTIEILDRTRIGDRMDFDVEYLVKAAWMGQPLMFVPTHVRYHEDGISHFRMVRDNVSITLMHTRLVIGMLLRLPMLLARKWFPRRYPTGPGGQLNSEYNGEKGTVV